jgi:hypothetical protein
MSAIADKLYYKIRLIVSEKCRYKYNRIEFIQLSQRDTVFLFKNIVI